MQAFWWPDYSPHLRFWDQGPQLAYTNNQTIINNRQIVSSRQGTTGNVSRMSGSFVCITHFLIPTHSNVSWNPAKLTSWPRLPFKNLTYYRIICSNVLGPNVHVESWAEVTANYKGFIYMVTKTRFNTPPKISLSTQCTLCVPHSRPWHQTSIHP